MANSYAKEQDIKNTELLRKQIGLLPEFMEEFFTGISLKNSSRTRLNYAYDLAVFFGYILKETKAFSGKTLADISVLDLELISVQDIENFLAYTTYYQKEEEKEKGGVIKINRTNEEKGKARKLAAIRAMFKYFYRKEKISKNPAALVDVPKIHEKNIVRLEIDELARLLDNVESGNNLTKRQKKLHQHMAVRDLAIISLLAGTGMRVSECVGINVSDLDFNRNSVKITRKGGNESVLFFGEEVKDALLALLEYREKNPPEDSNEDALFLSLQKKRMNVRTVQNLVKKYAGVTVSSKKISPHKLRSTFGTNLYRETGDIYLVADVLGHADVNVTKKHYAQIEESRREMAAKVTKLRRG